MYYEKKLLVLGGKGIGCVRLERTASGVSAELTAGNLTASAPIVVVRGGSGLLAFLPPSIARPYRFTLPPSCDLSTLTVIVADGESLLLCGTLGKERLWQSNLEDDVRRARKLLGTPPPTRTADLFTDLYSPLYDDNRVAEVNYYNKNYRFADEEIVASVPFTRRKIDDTPPIPIPKPMNPPAPEPSVTPPPVPQPKPEPIPEQPTPPINPSPIKEPTDTTEPIPEHKPESDESVAADEVFEPEPPNVPPPPVLEVSSFYDTVRRQLDKLFEKREHYGLLEKLLPDSRWVKIDYDNKGKYYLIGLVSQPVRYICYGVPGKYSPHPPSELAGYCQWLAVDESNPIGEGFWVMYQDAVTGKSVI